MSWVFCAVWLGVLKYIRVIVFATVGSLTRQLSQTNDFSFLSRVKLAESEGKQFEYDLGDCGRLSTKIN